MITFSLILTVILIFVVNETMNQKDAKQPVKTRKMTRYENYFVDENTIIYHKKIDMRS